MTPDISLLEASAFIDGRFSPAASGETFESENPANGTTFAAVAACGEEDVNRAVAAARHAFEAGHWSKAAPATRKKVLLRLADLIKQHSEEIAMLETLESGKPITDSRTVDIPDSIATLRWHAEAIDKYYDQISPAPHDVVSMLVREPMGVVAGVIPWNFPLFMAIWKLAPALAGGNSVLLKPAEQTSFSLLRVAGLAAEAGLPDGVLNVLPGRGEVTGRAIGLHPDIDCVSFTGSGDVGRSFLSYSAQSNLKKIVLECGGKSPAIVMPDAADLDHVTQEIATGILFCQGENCSAGSRLIIHESLKDEVIARLKPVFDTWTVGDPMNETTRIGALIERGHLDKVTGLIQRGVDEGAALVHGGHQVLQESGGYFVEPTIFDGVRNDMTIAREEIFGPVLSVISFRNEAEAIALANDTRYGLASSLYTNDLNTAHRMAKAIKTGTVSVNCYSEGDLAVPFGGFKESGFGGRDKGFAAHDQYTEQKSIWIQLR